MKSSDVYLRRAGSSCGTPCVLSCARDLWQGQRHSDNHRAAAFLDFKCLICKNKETGVEFLKSSRILWEHISLSPHVLVKKNKSHHNCVHLSSQLMYMAEILGLFLPTFSSGQNSQLGHRSPLGIYLLGQACRISPQRINCFLLNLCVLLSLANTHPTGLGGLYGLCRAQG